jgi:glycosyltransferase involved in cell wall biosynthesis
MCKFSVLIPTRDRLELLKYAIDSVLNQTYKDWEIIIADNCSAQDIEAYINSISDERIIYARSDKPLSVTDNWNVANRMATGDYIIMLGDDDALLPGYFEDCIEIIEQFNKPDILHYDAYIYTQQNVDPEYPLGRVYSTKTTAITDVRILSDIEKDLYVKSSFDFHYLFRFNMQVFLYSKEFVSKLEKYGEFYQGPYPDYYTANMMMLVSDSVVVIPKELVIIGVTKKSYGYYYHNNIEDKGMQFHNSAEYRKSAPVSVRDKLCNVSEIDTAALATFAIIPPKFPQREDLNLNIRSYLKRITKRIFKEYDFPLASAIFFKEVFPKVPLAQKYAFVKYALNMYKCNCRLFRKMNLNESKELPKTYDNIAELICALGNNP